MEENPMNWFDFVNAAFELSAGGFVLLNCIDIWRKKAVAGQAIPTIVFFLVWGVWNLVYYPSQGQWWSTVGAWGVLVANIAMAFSMWKFWERRL